ncbi:glycosyltransferase family 2 protein [Streptomyces albidoflavus]|uniref:glycosyltransferase family 2 protein n=2 Tax=Streptomyces TaxID=1883 RepID=UPI002E2F73A7|nr:glycosyltransferase [Streptomyces albidoflavus]
MEPSQPVSGEDEDVAGGRRVGGAAVSLEEAARTSYVGRRAPVVAVLMTSRNRRRQLLRALDALADQRSLPPGTALRVHLVDAGSRDGTAEAVRAAHPEVEVHRAGPRVRWGEGIRTASRNSRAAGATPFTHQFWLRDDVVLADEALALLLATSRALGDTAVVVGAVRDGGVPGARPGSGPLAYSGRRRTRLPHRLPLVEPSGRTEPCDTYDGAAVLLPRAARDRAGDLDRAFRHTLGDLDHGLRARRVQVPAFVAPRAVGERHAVPLPPTWEEPGIGVREALRRRAGELPPRAWWTYCRRHAGVRAPLLAAAPYLRTAVRAARG